MADFPSPYHTFEAVLRNLLRVTKTTYPLLAEWFFAYTPPPNHLRTVSLIGGMAGRFSAVTVLIVRILASGR